MDRYQFCNLGIEDLNAIMAIEELVYTHPWSRGNFLDSFEQGHAVCGIRDASDKLLGYFVLMPVVDELHLLTIAVDQCKQGQGYALILLRYLKDFAASRQFHSILLEVRISNRRAREIYQRFGFEEIGRRKAYYPAHNGQREDAIVMRMSLV
ncbi:ribosomal protein S18-alanine N-acetyltransferase [Undibacterium sp. FT137W]|uniref:[Ribosomal protein bS18]-alanine N-acetyltransferase n=2 Tax=Undibacterium fentianense TaxID=2828728 RepID=A0A941DY32_9BURK|nr:ribosomal protein S18-alanine N-acetyltransferase [Undibacterium fentianense]